MAAPTDDLRHEHDAITKMLQAMSRGSDRIVAAGEVDLEFWKGVSDFLQHFVDECHHAKEEKYLFPAMMERGVSGEVGPIAVMMREHDDGRAHAKRLRGFLNDAKPTSKAGAGISKSARAYVDLLSMHIEKENGVLFPLADQVLTPEDQEALVADFEKVENATGPSLHEKYVRMADQWQMRYE